MKNGQEGGVREKMTGSTWVQSAHLTPIPAHVMAKVSKHLALLACMMILAHASGRAEIGSLGIFILVVLAALVHSAERTLRRCLPVRIPSREE